MLYFLFGIFLSLPQLLPGPTFRIPWSGRQRKSGFSRFWPILGDFFNISKIHMLPIDFHFAGTLVLYRIPIDRHAPNNFDIVKQFEWEVDESEQCTGAPPWGMDPMGVPVWFNVNSQMDLFFLYGLPSGGPVWFDMECWMDLSFYEIDPKFRLYSIRVTNGGFIRYGTWTGDRLVH